MEKDKIQLELYSQTESYPWPNSTTTIKTSDAMKSKVLFADVDGDYYEDAVFISNSSSSSIAAIQNPVIRVVASGNFKEILNIESLVTRPNPHVKMLLTDIDLNNGPKELIYLSESNQRIIAIDLVEPNIGVEKLSLSVVEVIDRQEENAFRALELADSKLIEIGNNRVRISLKDGVSVESAFDKVDGGWSEWSKLNDKCSKSCGDGILAKMRLCTNPTPRNGGAQCVGAAVETQVCRVRDCQPSECSPYEVFENGSCNSDPENPPPATGGSGSSGGVSNPGSGGGSNGGGSGSGGPFKPGTCPVGKVWDPFFFACFKPYPLNNIFLTYRELSWESDKNNNTRYITHTYRLSLSHPKARGLSAKATAAEYCRFRGYKDAMSYKTATYKAGTGNNSRNVFVLCNIGTNGLYYGRGGCPVGNYVVSFSFRNILHKQDESVTYLKSVVCRKDN